MSEAAATAERREEILGELAEWMHAAAREAQRRLLQAETSDDFARLTGSLAKLARGVRQSILLQRKLESERLEAARLAGEADDVRNMVVASEFVSRHVRRVRLRTAITRHVWREVADEDEADLFRDDLNARLDELERTEDFLDIPIDDQIAQLCRDLGFVPPDARASSDPSAPPAAGLPAAVPPAPERAGARPGAAHLGTASHAPNTS